LSIKEKNGRCRKKGVQARIPLEETGAIGVRLKAAGWKGLFALRRIPRGTLILPDWHGAFYDGLAGWRRFSVREVEELAPDRRSLVIQYGLDLDFGWIAGPIDAEAVTTSDNYINHSCAPNMGYDFEGNVIADRDIRAGEELTLDYGCFAVNLDEPFECDCSAPDCRKRVRRTDWRMLAKTRGLAMPRFLHPFVAAADIRRRG
jgi:uncharacterized protein